MISDLNKHQKALEKFLEVRSRKKTRRKLVVPHVRKCMHFFFRVFCRIEHERCTAYMSTHLKKNKVSSFSENLKKEKKKHRSLGNSFINVAEDTATDLKQLKRKFCELSVSEENCPFKKVKQEEEIVDVEINSPAVGTIVFFFCFLWPFFLRR